MFIGVIAAIALTLAALAVYVIVRGKTSEDTKGNLVAFVCLVGCIFVAQTPPLVELRKWILAHLSDTVKSALVTFAVIAAISAAVVGYLRFREQRTELLKKLPPPVPTSKKRRLDRSF